MEPIQTAFDVSYAYPVLFSRGSLDPANTVLRDLIAGDASAPVRVLAFVDDGLLAAAPRVATDLAAYAAAHADRVDLLAPPIPVRGGERSKSDPAVVRDILTAISEHGLCRQSVVLVVGGGAVIDAVGYAAATAHRGIGVVRLPTTVLAQNDASIGVKNAINFRGQKNFLGTFAPPRGVLNDFDLLATQGERDRRAGIAEAIKVALIRDGAFFESLVRDAEALAAFAPGAMQAMIRRCAELHLAHIATSGDPFERGSARPLDFGHWLAHHLEERSGFALRHGEAVAIGIAVDSIYSEKVGLLAAPAHRILDLLATLGFPLQPLALADVARVDIALAEIEVERALESFRAHLGGELCITLLADIGVGVEVNEIDPALVCKSIEFLCEHAPI